jgi:hypothetical protein
MKFFELTTAAQLFQKMESDMAALVAFNSNSHLAFNFFVTAEHLPDWLGKRELVKSTALLRIVSHLANGAKHLTLDPKRHNSVVETSINRYVEEGYVLPGYLDEPLLIHLSAEEALELGKPVFEAQIFGAMVIEFWRPHLAP